MPCSDNVKPLPLPVRQSVAGSHPMTTFPVQANSPMAMQVSLQAHLFQDKRWCENPRSTSTAIYLDLSAPLILRMAC